MVAASPGWMDPCQSLGNISMLDLSTCNATNSKEHVQCQKSPRIGCVIPRCTLQCKITQPILWLFWHICTYNMITHSTSSYDAAAEPKARAASWGRVREEEPIGDIDSLTFACSFSSPNSFPFHFPLTPPHLFRRRIDSLTSATCSHPHVTTNTRKGDFYIAEHNNPQR